MVRLLAVEGAAHHAPTAVAGLSVRL
jgi:hypothetical protein